MPKRKMNLEAPLQSLRGASIITGLSLRFLRDGCKDGSIPHIMVGKEYRINMPLFCKQLGIEQEG